MLGGKILTERLKVVASKLGLSETETNGVKALDSFLIS